MYSPEMVKLELNTEWNLIFENIVFKNGNLRNEDQKFG